MVVVSYFCPACMIAVSADTEVCVFCSLPRPRVGWPRDVFVGRTINDRYRVERRLGAGAFGLVFLARQVRGDIDLGEAVLKFLHRGMATFVSDRQRFINEARAARRIRNPHVVKVFDLDFDEEGIPFMVMEYLEGQSLRDIMDAKGRLAPDRVLRIAFQVADALEECHAAGIVHRDLKPANLLVLGKRHDDFIKVIDFGIARVPSKGSTHPSSLAGTPQYMPPEQILGSEIDGRADIFALGVILYECFAGSPPIEARSANDYIEKNLETPPTPLRSKCPEMPADLEELLGQMLAKRRQERPGSMSEVAQRLREIGVHQGWLPEETGRIVLPPQLSAEPAAEPPSLSAEFLAHLRESSRYDLIEARGQSYHVQTEIIGARTAPKVQTTVLAGGVLLHTHSVPFPLALSSAEAAVEVIDAQHANVMQRVERGEIG